MKQKIVITLNTVFNEETRKKAFKTAVSQSGVDSVALTGNERNQIEVIGEQVDAAQLTIMLRKKVGCADLSSVNPVTENEEKPPEPLPTPEPTPPEPTPMIAPCPYCLFYQRPCYQYCCRY